MSSIIFGMLASVLPNLLFYWLFFRPNDKSPEQYIKYIYKAEGIKFVALALVMIAFLQWPGIQVVKFFAMFLLFELLKLLYLFSRLVRTTN